MTDRIPPPVTAGERETLRAFLDFHRATLAGMCAGLSDAQLRRRSVPPSALSLLGLVRHLAEVERAWFRRTLAGEDVGPVWSSGDDLQAAWEVGAAGWDEAVAAWEAEVAAARRIEAAAETLEVTGFQRRRGEDVSLRFVLVHLIAEYARHNGHADLLRESIDGAVGT